MNNKILGIFLSSAFILSACNSSESLNTTPNVALSWSQGVFADESIFKSRCESPRTGEDINGNAYSDQAGSKLYEKHWLRSWSNNTYLWYDEIIDSDVALIDDPVSYFETLKTPVINASGVAQDRFHYAQDTEDYLQLTSGGAGLGYGAFFKLLKTTPPREGRIAYIEPNSPAASANLSRGAEIVAIDGVDFVNGDDTAILNAGLLPSADGEMHIFTVRDLGQTVTRNVTLQAEVVTNEPVKNAHIINTTSGKVGYLALNTFATTSAEAALVDAFTDLAADIPDDLVIDLRYNRGGYLAISAQLGYMIAGPTLSNGKVFEKTVFNDKHPAIDPVTGNSVTYIPFIESTIGFSTTVNQPLPTLNLNRVFILASGDTCSASESLINGLRGIDVDVVLIGDTTCGKPYGFYSTDNCGVTYSTIQFRGENDKDFGNYAAGFSPSNAVSAVGEQVQGCQLIENVLHPLGDQQEALLSAALNYRETSLCPIVSAARAEEADAVGDLRNESRFKRHTLHEQIRLDKLRVIKE